MRELPVRRLQGRAQAGRISLCCEALESAREAPVIEAVASLFQERGLPLAMPDGPCDRSKLSAWRPRPSIAIERIRPGMNVLDQQGRLDAFVGAFNDERPTRPST